MIDTRSTKSPIRAVTRLAWNIYERLYKEECKGLDEKIYTRWPAHCHVTYHVHVVELQETPTKDPWEFLWRRV